MRIIVAVILLGILYIFEYTQGKTKYIYEQDKYRRDARKIFRSLLGSKFHSKSNSRQKVNNIRDTRKKEESIGRDIGDTDVHKIFRAVSRAEDYKNSGPRRYIFRADTDGKLNNWKEAETGTVNEPMPPENKDELALLVEKELLNSLSQKASAVLDRVYVQKKGRNEFLVLRPEIRDPFVTVVPNDIYYGIEKKCVNWLDDCNLRGLRDRLLQKVNSPFK